MSSLSALLSVMALRRRPQATKWLLTRSMDIRRTTDGERELLKRLDKQNGWNLDADTPAENTSDLNIGDTPTSEDSHSP